MDMVYETERKLIMAVCYNEVIRVYLKSGNMTNSEGFFA